jgi:hypothetical protein
LKLVETALTRNDPTGFHCRHRSAALLYEAAVQPVSRHRQSMLRLQLYLQWYL